jgi:hypothetical protein
MNPQVTLAYCTKVLRDNYDGKCGCAGDVSVDEAVFLGVQTSSWNPLDWDDPMAAICLTPSDVRPGSANPNTGTHNGALR